MAYLIKNSTVYSKVLLHPEQRDVNHEEGESWTRKGSKKEMMGFYKDWNATVQRFLSYVHEGKVMEWTLSFQTRLYLLVMRVTQCFCKSFLAYSVNIID